ncbi:cytochrome P450 [Rhizodiscina lignyota]|uniref:Cytochrome P450 n=1 Tax=Rhizodiscina lignyota TaxID=1504668 RepID=A0A9P4MDG9_9PEZI|nr:cytochrome P450 [Rhizodiscina lignyota]
MTGLIQLHSIRDISGLASLSAAVIGLCIIYAVGSVCYNVFFHPLAAYPGPKLAAASRIWYCFYALQGRVPFVLSELHKKYGDVIRIAPDELSYTAVEGWNQIYGHRPGKPEITKDRLFYSTFASGPHSLITADRSRHGHLRKQLSYGFSEKALRGQEHLIRSYADLVVDRLKATCKGGSAPVDMFFTFDTMGGLVFGEPFGCIENSDWHPLVRIVFDSVKFGTFVRCANHFPFLTMIVRSLAIPGDLKRRRKDQRRMTKEKTDYRKSLETENADLISGLLKEDSGATDDEYRSTSETLIIAGGETTATLLSGVTYYLLKNPNCMKRVVAEIRSSFTSADEINVVSVNKLNYLLACLNEALRVYPPASDGFPRNTGPHTEMICGKAVPPNTVIRMTQYATYHSPSNFVRPDEFLPERWLDEENNKESEFSQDKKSALQPFHVGPRNCLGRNLAYFEMRLLMAMLLWNFDMELLPESEDWIDHPIYLLWEKPQLMVRLTPRSDI